MASYDRAVTVFSPDGRLLQVQYAQEAVRKGGGVVGVRGADVVVLVCEKKVLPCLYEGRTKKNIVKLDSHVAMAYAGLRADARVLITKAQVECQAHRLSVEDAVTVDYIARFVAQVQQMYTQCNGRRPFGISCMIGGVDSDGSPHLFQTEPSGVFYEWKAAATGRNDKQLRAYLEQHYKPELVCTEEGAIRLALSALVEIQPPDSPYNYEVAVSKNKHPVTILDQRDVKAFVSHILKQKANADKAKRFKIE